MTIEPEDEKVLLTLMQTGQMIVNSHWFKTNWPDDAKNSISIAVCCNDLFGPAADAQGMDHDDMREAYRMHVADPEYCRGLMAWCVKKRKQRPWSKGERMLRGAPWSIDELVSSLPANSNSAGM